MIARILRLAAVLAAAALLTTGVFYWLLNSAPPSSHDEFFSIPIGTTASRVASLLEDTGQIRSRAWFLSLVNFRRAAGKIRAGVYQIKAGQSSSEILRVLVNGDTRKVRVTVPEGWASWQIAERLEAQKICSAESFKTAVATAAAEGYLFPETYHFDQGVPAPVIVEIMRAQFERVWEHVLQQAVSSGSVRLAGEKIEFNGRAWSRGEVVALASLVEREARKPEERPLISAVYHNRLKKRMPLEADPTVQFALGYWKSRVVFQDLEIDSPYNTYRRRGLPPGPICSPGREALRAALAPAPADFLYFVADVSGGHHFSASFGEHQRKVKQWNAERRQKRIEQLRRNRTER